MSHSVICWGGDYQPHLLVHKRLKMELFLFRRSRAIIMNNPHPLFDYSEQQFMSEKENLCLIPPFVWFIFKIMSWRCNILQWRCQIFFYHYELRDLNIADMFWSMTIMILFISLSHLCIIGAVSLVPDYCGSTVFHFPKWEDGHFLPVNWSCHFSPRIPVLLVENDM